MRCHDAQKLSSLYLDGDLSHQRSSAVRGHLRTCESCELYFEQEAAIVEAASSLEPLDPPDHIWRAIQQQVAEAEIEDSKQAPWKLWLLGTWRPLLGAGALAAAALVWFALRTTPMTEALPTASTESAPGVEQPVKTHEQQVAREVSEADNAYKETIVALRELLEEDRSTWTRSQEQSVDAKLASFSREADVALAQYPAVDSREQVYAVHRSEIDFLQSALAGRLGDLR